MLREGQMDEASIRQYYEYRRRRRLRSASAPPPLPEDDIVAAPLPSTREVLIEEPSHPPRRGIIT